MKPISLDILLDGARVTLPKRLQAAEMKHSGRCYCGDIQFEFTEPIHSQILCHCRECRYLSGGEPNASIVISENSIR